jgi:hypothetical protein
MAFGIEFWASAHFSSWKARGKIFGCEVEKRGFNREEVE